MYKKILVSLLAVTLLIASVALAFAGPLHGLFAQANTPTLTDMNTQGGGSDPWGTAFDSTGRVWVAVPSCDPTPQCGSIAPGQMDVYSPQNNSWPVTYKYPSGFGQSLFLAFDKQGRVWFPMPMSNSLGMFNPATNTFSQWAVPTAGAGPWDVAIDANGIVWFTEHYINQIGSFNPTTDQFTEIATPLANSQPYGITVDSSNNVWFTENNSSVAQIAEYTAQHSLHEYKIRNGSTNGLTPHLITTDHNGNVWWSEGWPGAIGKLAIAASSPDTNAGVTEYIYQPACASCGTHTSGITVDQSGQVWFTDSLQSILGSFNPGSSTFALYNTPTSNSHPHDGLNLDAQNNIWFTEEFANKLAHAVLPAIAKPTPTPVKKPTPPPVKKKPTPVVTLGLDTFHRASRNLWGKSSAGQTWGGDANTSRAFIITGNRGTVVKGVSFYSAVLGAAAANEEVVSTGAISSFANSNFGGVLRWTNNGNFYKAYLDGTSLLLQKRAKGVTRLLARIPFRASTASSYTIDFRIIGSTMNVRVWKVGTPVPSRWMITTVDHSLASGYAGIGMQVIGSAKLSFSYFKANKLP
jgi:streptogramin lyase